MGNILLGLGETRFQVTGLAYKQLDRALEIDWQSQRRIGRRPAKQFVGIGEETIDFTGQIFPKDPRFGDGLGHFERLRRYSQLGTPLPLGASVGGYGIYHGQWVIMSIGDSQSHFGNDGVPWQIEFNISIENYGPDGGSIFEVFR